MDADLNAILTSERDRCPPTALMAAFYAEMAYRDGWKDIALRLIDLAYSLAEQEIDGPNCLSIGPKL